MVAYFAEFKLDSPAARVLKEEFVSESECQLGRNG